MKAILNKKKRTTLKFLSIYIKKKKKKYIYEKVQVNKLLRKKLY